MRPWIQRRVLFGQYETLFAELMRESRGDFKSYMRMEPDMFRELIQRIEPRITKNSQ